jgi:hypothetical protein
MSELQKRVVSISLGSSTRNHSATAQLLGQDFQIERIGTDGDLALAARRIEELDGRVAAIGLGGIDLYVVAGNKRYVMRDAAKLAAMAKQTPVVDGSGLKHTLEREAVRYLQTQGIVNWPQEKVLLVSAVDRFGMAEELVAAGAACTFGDFLFILELPFPLRSLNAVRKLGAVILPVATRLPFKMLYPTGEKQTQIKDSKNHRTWMKEASVIAGDFLLIRRYLPENLQGKTIFTNTVTRDDIELLRQRGARQLVTTTPEFDGRSFGTNVMEGVFVALGARQEADYLPLLQQLKWSPRIIRF